MGSCACKAGAVARLVGGRCGGEFVSCDAKPPRLFLSAHATAHVEPAPVDALTRHCDVDEAPWLLMLLWQVDLSE